MDTSSELLLQRYNTGVKLVRPNKQSSAISVGEILKNDFHVYFLNVEHQVQNVNEAGASALKASSIQSFIGCNVLDIFSKECGEQIQRHDQRIFTENKMLVMDEELIVEDYIYQTLAIKTPWYDQDGKLLGLLGCSIEIGNHSLSHSLNQLIQAGLFPRSYKFAEKTINNISLTKRQDEVLRLIVRGKTIKEIALLLGISSRTVGHYFESIKAKMNVTTKSELIDKVINHYLCEIN